MTSSTETNAQLTLFTVGTDSTRSAIPPWERIPVHRWDREALQRWYEGYSSPEISKKIGYAPKTVLNRLCILRQMYGTDLVPKNPQRWKRIREIGTGGCA